MGAHPDGQAAERLSGEIRALERRLVQLEARVRQLEGARTTFQESLNRLGDALVDTHDRHGIISAVLDTSAAYVQASVGAFYVLVAGRNQLRPLAVSGLADDEAVGELAVGEGVAGRAAATGTVALWPWGDPQDEAPSSAEPLTKAATAVAVPVRVSGRLYGVLALYGRSIDAAFSRTDVDTVSTLVHQVEPAIENTYLYEEAQRLALTDGLTSLWNRRQFDLRLRGEVQRSARFGDPFALVLADIDRFKEVNDRFGHQAGDAVLIEVARRLMSAVRDVDVVARIGGEEFALILPNTPLDGALHLAERVRAALAGEAIGVDGAAIRITLSAGVAGWPGHGTTPARLVRSADAALYQAKAEGRNRVRTAEEGLGPSPPDTSS